MPQLESHAPVRLPSSLRNVVYDEVSASLAYFGVAAPGANTGDPVWMIQRFNFGPGNSLATTFADGNAEFDNVWNDRTSLSYS